MIYVVSNRAGYQFFRFSLNTLLRIEVRDLSSWFERLVWHRARKDSRNAFRRAIVVWLSSKARSRSIKEQKECFFSYERGKWKKKRTIGRWRGGYSGTMKMMYISANSYNKPVANAVPSGIVGIKDVIVWS